MMTTYSTKIHTPAAIAPATSGKIAKCKLCKAAWQVHGSSPDYIDAQACAFCGCADVIIINEDNNYPQVNKIGL